MNDLHSLHNYLRQHAVRCDPAVADADVIFFGVSRGPDAKAEELKALLNTHKGDFCEVDPLDGNAHNYIELGGWLGDQGAALTLIGLGAALGLWQLQTPKTMLGPDMPDEVIRTMAGMGLVTMQAMPTA